MKLLLASLFSGIFCLSSLIAQKDYLPVTVQNSSPDSFPAFYIKKNEKDLSSLVLYKKTAAKSGMVKAGKFPLPSELKATNLEFILLPENEMVLIYHYPDAEVYRFEKYHSNKNRFVLDTAYTQDVRQEYMNLLYTYLDSGTILPVLDRLGDFKYTFDYTDTASLCFRIFEKTYQESLKLAQSNQSTEALDLMNKMWAYPPMTWMMEIITPKDLTAAIQASSWPMTSRKYLDIMYFYGEALLYVGQDYELCSQVCKLLLKLDPEYMPGVQLTGNLHAATGFEAEKCKYYNMYMKLATRNDVEVPTYMISCRQKQ